MSSYHLKKKLKSSCFRRLSIECSNLTKLTGGVNVHKVGKYGVKAHLHKSFQELWVSVVTWKVLHSAHFFFSFYF